jgi:hypothetical protein
MIWLVWIVGVLLALGVVVIGIILYAGPWRMAVHLTGRCWRRK